MIPFYRPSYNGAELLALFRPTINRDSFEAAVAAKTGAQYSLAFGYGRAALLAVFKALGLAGVEVIVPAYLCQAVAQVIVAAGNSLRFVDIDLDTYNMDLKGLKQALTSQTRVIMAVHMYGYPIDIPAMRATVGDERIMILEDSAPAPLRFTPQSSNLTLFSLGMAKPLTTLDGGVIATNSADLYEKVKAYRDREMNTRPVKSYMNRYFRLAISYLLFGRWTYPLWHPIRRRRLSRVDNQDVQNRDLPPIQQLPADLGVVYSNFQARLGIAQLGKLETILTRRRRLAEIYDQELAGLMRIAPAPIVLGAAYSYYTIRVPRRDESGFWRRMVQRGVATDWNYEYALPELKSYQRFADRSYRCATQAAGEVINLPCFPDLSDDQARWIASCVRESIHEIQKEGL